MQRTRHAGHVEGQFAADLAHSPNAVTVACRGFEAVGLDDPPELIERHPVVRAEADVRLGPLERQLHRFDPGNFLNADAHAVRAGRAVHPQDLQLDALVLGPGLRWHEQHQQDRREMNGSHRLYRRQKKYVKLTPNRNFSSSGGSALLVHGEEYAAFEPILLVEHQRGRADEDARRRRSGSLEPVMQTPSGVLADRLDEEAQIRLRIVHT